MAPLRGQRSVGRFGPRSGRVSAEIVENKLFVGNLDLRLTELQIIKLFEPFGELHHVEYVWHLAGPKKGEPRGFCFIEYKHHEDAVKAMEGMNEREVQGRALVVNFAHERTAEQPERKRIRLAEQDRTVQEQTTSRSLASMVVPRTLDTASKIAMLERKLKKAGATVPSSSSSSSSSKATESTSASNQSSSSTSHSTLNVYD